MGQVEAEGVRGPLARGTGKPRLGLSPSDGDSRSLLQSRLRLFHLVLFALSGAMLAISLGMTTALQSAEFDRPTLLSSVVVAGLVAAAGTSWLVLRHGPLPTGALHALDALICGIGGLLTAGWMALLSPMYRPELAGLLVMTQVLFGRAALVPSAPMRTVGCGAATLLPLVIATHFVLADGAAPPWLEPAGSIVALVAFLSAIIIVLSALTSRVIFGLRRKVAQAMRAMQLGQYTVERLIGRGGMGSVYLARHALLRRPTALKVLQGDAAGEEAIARFEREVQTTSELTHPHTVAIYDYGRTPDDCFYYAMEYLDGVDLDVLVAADGPQPPGRVVHLLRQVCGALAEAHGRGLVHRDIKPANIMLCERGRHPDFVKVLDFGLVHTRDPGAPQLSRELTVRGTPLYMAPESISRPAEVGVAADVYAVGAVAYFLLAGCPPFDGDTPIEVMARHVHERPQPPSARCGRAVPDRLEALVLACLEKRPEQRPASMDELLAAMDEVDAEPWSEAAARAWWRERAPRLRGVASPGHASATPPTIAIDLARRADGIDSTLCAPAEAPTA